MDFLLIQNYGKEGEEKYDDDNSGDDENDDEKNDERDSG